MSLNNDELLNNVKRQAKRLSKSLDIPLGQAQEMLAHVVYDCNGYGDLISSVKAISFKNEYLPLTALHPKADFFLFKLLDTHLNNIADRLEEKLVNKKINEEAKNIILNIFAIEPTDFERKIK
ncbi:hypothetical protein ACOYR1_15210 [Thalassotalea piscium]